MPVHNANVAEIFNQMAGLLEIEGANPFRVRADQNAAHIISGQSKSVGEMVAQGKDLTKLPRIRKDLPGKINEIVQTGSKQIRTK